MPIGMLIKKHARHELSSMLNCTSAPSISCAASATRPIAALYMPIALRRSAPWKETPMIARTCGINIAPATPWARRPTISTVAFGARPHASEERVNSATPSKYSGADRGCRQASRL